MAIDPTNGKSLGQMMLRVCESLGVQGYDTATGAPELPDDTFIRDLAKKAVNDSMVRFMTAVDGRGRSVRWTWMKPTLTLTLSPTADGSNVAGQVWRKRLPTKYAGRPSSDWIVDSSSARQPVKDSHPGEILRRRAAFGATSGLPQIAAMRPMDDGPTQRGRGWELLVWPDPDQVYTLSADFVLQPFKLEELDDLHPAGIAHDETIEVGAMLLANRRYGAADPAKLGGLESEYLGLLAASIALDRANEPRNLGVMHDPAMAVYADPAAATRGEHLVPDRLTYDGVEL